VGGGLSAGRRSGRQRQDEGEALASLFFVNGLGSKLGEDLSVRWVVIMTSSQPSCEPSEGQSQAELRLFDPRIGS